MTFSTIFDSIYFCLCCQKSVGPPYFPHVVSNSSVVAANTLLLVLLILTRTCTHNRYSMNVVALALTAGEMQHFQVIIFTACVTQLSN